MSTSSTDPVLRARKISSTVVKRMHDGTSQAAVAAAMGMSESTVSRFISDHLDKFALVLAHTGLRVVDERKRCFDPEYVDALRTLAREYIKQAPLARDLDWSDD